MKVFIAGIDGYLGWPLAQHLAARGHRVAGCDSFARRRWVEECGSYSAVPVAAIDERRAGFRSRFGRALEFFAGDLTDPRFVADCLDRARPDAVVHLGQMPSAPYSMIDLEHCVYTHTNNMVGTLNLLHVLRDRYPDAHLLKLGTMGEYGTPNVDIPEGFFDIEYRGRRDRLPFPRQAGSWYHQTKVHDSHNIAMACRLWGLRSTDVMQGVVFGTRVTGTGDANDDPRLLTRFDFDQCFGTVINRFCAMAVIGMPLTPFGSGGQKRGFIPLRDSVECLALAIENPPAAGEYRVFNQFQEVYGVRELARRVQRVAGERLGLQVAIEPVENPRTEAEDHYYRPDCRKLRDLGYQPCRDLDAELETVLRDLLPVRARIGDRRRVLASNIRWDGRTAPEPDQTPLPPATFRTVASRM